MRLGSQEDDTGNDWKKKELKVWKKKRDQLVDRMGAIFVCPSPENAEWGVQTVRTEAMKSNHYAVI